MPATRNSPKRNRTNGAPAEDRYRQRWRWDSVTWGSHCVDCYPSNCPYRVFVRDGKVIREEQAGAFPVIEPGVPDMNPAGCQKGAMWSQMLYGQERVLYPMKRVGARGSGKWTRVGWDEALSDIADKLIDAIQEVGPESIIRIGEPAEGGTQALICGGALVNRLGGITTDVQAEINDFSPGLYVTYGKFDPASSVDDWFHSELVLIWHANPIYTNIPWYHFIAEARYNGAEVALIAPDYSPSAVHTDFFAPIRIGTDAALALGMCQILIEEGLYHAPFVKEQTDLPLLVRLDTRRFLRASDVDGGRDDQFYWFDTNSSRIVEAPRGTLALGTADPALEGEFEATLADSSRVRVVPAFVLLRELLDREYRPEQGWKVTGVHPDVMRRIARTAARKRTRLLMGWNSGKYYHGDLMERSMALFLALTGNWGKKGTGARSWAVGMFDGMFTTVAKSRPGPEAARQLFGLQQQMLDAIKAEDPTMTDEIAVAEQGYRGARMGGMVPAVFFWYYHCGYRDRWNNAAWNDPSMKRPFDDYVREGIERGWWEGFRTPDEKTPPRVIFEIGSNVLRRTRGGADLLVEELWPKLKLIVTIDWRMNTTGLYSDYILPAAHHYEKPNFCYTTPHVMNLTLSDKAADPPGEALSEWQITLRLAKAIEARAKARNFVEYPARNTTIRLDDLYESLTKHGAVQQDERLLDEMVRDSAVAGTLPEGTTLQTLRKQGFVRFIDWGRTSMALAQASDIKPDETHAPFRWHTEKKQPFPTLTRRAQFYIDHDWFLEAGEALPVHKETPGQGGSYPFLLTSGHPRWSIHSMNMTNRVILETHRGHPFVFINPDDARARGIENDEEVRVRNDVSEMTIAAKISPSVRPGQLIIYNGWEPYQFRSWKGAENVEPGMIKWLHLAGGYGHLQYRTIHWQPVPIDRAVHVDVEKIVSPKKARTAPARRRSQRVAVAAGRRR
jgi:DMSO reductase family type II enzyme molybdopterin subunit